MRLLLFAVCVVLVCACSDAWFGRRQGGGRGGGQGGGRGGGNGRVRTAVDRTRGSVRKAVDRTRGAVRTAVDKTRGAVRTAVDRTREAVQGAGDMYRAYSDMREANWKNSDKYFHARGNYDAAQRGPGGKWAAKVISDVREGYQSAFRGQSEADRRADQEANLWGRNGGDPNVFRPEGLPDPY